MNYSRSLRTPEQFSNDPQTRTYIITCYRIIPLELFFYFLEKCFIFYFTIRRAPQYTLTYIREKFLFEFIAENILRCV